MAETTVKLSCKVLEKKDVEYEISHAQNLLDTEKKMGVQNWVLTDPQFMLDNGIIKRANNNADKTAKTKGSVDKGAEA